ncbi:hypothetical protein AB0M43_21290 [Longispora sp. NPDC051575]|uniref:hypothetical protein n=1 Tax=Longispora sp. NPDC051575 TaxID=3154943 RepID=UPI00343E662B
MNPEALVGLFVTADTRPGDRRLALAGLRPTVVLAARLAVITLGVALSTAAALAVTAAVFSPRQWALYFAANLLIAGCYALIGVILAPVFDRVAGVFIAFLFPFLDLGIAQSPMLRGQPAAWAHYLPGYGGTRVLIDAAVTDTFDETRSLLIALSWIAVLTVTAAVIYRRAIRPARR